MAINVSFNGATIFKPGAYSKTTIDLGGGFPIGPSGLIVIFGEADGGAPGTDETDIAQNRFSADQLVTVRNKYRSGPIVDACNFLFAPGSDAAIPGGAQTVWIYKTNASTRAEHAMASAFGTVQAIEYGITGNRITYTATADTDSAPAVSTGTALTFSGIAEQSQVTADTLANTTDGDHFDITSQAGTTYRVYMDTTGGSLTIPAVTTETLVEVDISAVVTAIDVADAVATRVALIVDFTAPVTGTGVIVITDINPGTATDIAATQLTNAWAVSTPVQGEASDGTFLNNATFDIVTDGNGTTTTVALSATESDHESTALLAVEISAQLAVLGMSCIESVTTPGALEISIDAAVTDSTDGFGHSFELIETNIGDLALMGLVEVFSTAAIEPYVSVALDHKVDDIQETDILGGNIVLSIGRDATGSAISASVTVSADSVILTEDVGAGSVAVKTMLKSSFSTLAQVAAEINLQSGWTATTGNGTAGTGAIYNQLNPDVLDIVTTVGAFSTAAEKPARLKKDADDVRTFFELSFLTRLSGTAPTTGLPDAETEVSLGSGANVAGTKGPTAPADILDALDKFTKFHVNSIVPLFSRDATADITDGLTDDASNYTIEGIHQQVKTHVSLMKTTKRRSERQGYLSFRGSYADAKESAGTLADGRFQLCIQDVRQTDSQGVIKWFQPWALSCLLAGARGGSPIGEPMTFKFLNTAGIRQTAQSLNTDEADIVVDFDPDLQTDDAIQAGITFMEAPQTGGFRIVVDNTTYGKDGNFVFNRANVLYAADIVAYNFRNGLENIYVGRKNAVSVSDISGTASSLLTGFLAQGITVSTQDAPQGFKNLTVEIQGNTIIVNVIIKIVEGIDFILSEITIQRATSA